MKEQIVDLAMNNGGIRDTALALHISINVAFWCTDNFSAYDMLPDEKHIRGKLCTQRIECKNLNIHNS